MAWAGIQHRRRTNLSLTLRQWELLLQVGQWELLRQVAAGYTTVQIVRRPGISAGTVRTHVQNTYSLLQVPSRTAAVTRKPGDQPPFDAGRPAPAGHSGYFRKWPQ